MKPFPFLPGVTVFQGERRNLRLSTEIIQLLDQAVPVIVIDAKGHYSQQVRMLSGQRIVLRNEQEPEHQCFGDSLFFLFEIHPPIPLDLVLNAVKFHCNHLENAVICLVDYDQLPSCLFGADVLPRLRSECRAQIYLTAQHSLPADNKPLIPLVPGLEIE